MNGNKGKGPTGVGDSLANMRKPGDDCSKVHKGAMPTKDGFKGVGGAPPKYPGVADSRPK